jgi:ferritin-like metal-binding protein YciE
METVNELFEDQIKDLYSAENQLLKALPKMAKKATSLELKTGFENHLKQTQEHIARLGQIAEMWEFKLTGKKCKAMEGLVQEGKEVLEENGDDSVMDTALIAAARRVEHYEISAYMSAKLLAEKLGCKDCTALLQSTLSEELDAEKLLESICKSGILKDAPIQKQDQ